MNHTTLMSSRSACQRRHFKEPTSELQERLCSRDSPRGGRRGLCRIVGRISRPSQHHPHDRIERVLVGLLVPHVLPTRANQRVQISAS